MAEALVHCFRSLLPAHYTKEGGEVSSPEVGIEVGIVLGMKVGIGGEF